MEEELMEEETSVVHFIIGLKGTLATMSGTREVATLEKLAKELLHDEHNSSISRKL